MTDAEPPAPNISTAAIELLALECDAEAREWASMQLEPMFELIAATLRALAAERDAQAAEIERLLAALQWCSGSADFNAGGIAREGWLTLCAPLLTGGKNG